MARSRTESLIGFVKEDGPLREVPPVRVGVAHVLWWLVVMIGCCVLIHGELPPAPQSWTTAKLEDFEKHKDEYDLIFLGSSQLYRHVDPVLFDKAFAEAGHSIHSFNFGVPGMGALENRWILQKVLAMKPARLKTVVFDAPAPGALLGGMNHITPRVKAWHDLVSTWLAVKLVWQTGMSTSWKLDMTERHLVSFGYRLCNVGSVRELLDIQLKGTAVDRTEARNYRVTDGPGGLGENGRGFVSMDRAVEAVPDSDPYQRKLLMDRYRKMQQGLAGYAKRLRENPNRPRPMLEYTGKPREVQELLPAELEILASMVKLAEDAGIEPIFTNAPDIRQKEYFITEAAKAGVIPTLIDLDDPAKHKNLLAPELRFDELHLRESGAALYTEALAWEVASHLYPVQDGDPRR
ncbi:MAG: hypothetical protein P8N09_08465 [Planctomycetota bacterium]|jgi:hypothetical protein|nr:hypothetical protein [Planctomycetota bacterium]